MTTRAQALAEATRRLAEAGVPSPARDARLLGRWAADLDGAGFLAAIELVPDDAEQSRFARAIADRAHRRPVSQITGQRAFWGRDFVVTPDVLDPRPESETLISVALEQPAARVLDLGVGSGCLLLTLLSEWPEATGVGVDLSHAALDVAGRNATALGCAERVDLVPSDWFQAVEGRFDLIVANPPYLSDAELRAVEPELSFEPGLALSPGGDGLDAYRRIYARAAGFLEPGARLICEIGHRQAADVRGLASASGFADCRVVRDLDGRDRVIWSRMATES